MKAKLLTGNIVEQHVEVIVNSWNRNIIPWWLLLPQGVSGAIKKSAGLQPFKEVARFGPIPLGEARQTGAGKLNFKAIIHVAGINMFWYATERSVRQSVISAMEIVKEQQFKSVAFPLIGSGSGNRGKEWSLNLMNIALESITGTAEVFFIIKELTQQETDQYNHLFKTASTLIKPFLFRHGDAQEKAGRKKLIQAIAMYDKALSIYPGGWQSMWLRGKSYQALSETDSAYRSFRQAYFLMPENPDVVNEYLIEAVNLHKISEALLVNKKAVKQFPYHAQLQANYVLVLLLAGDVEHAVRQGRMVLKMKPDDKITIKLLHIAKAIRAGKMKPPAKVDELTERI